MTPPPMTGAVSFKPIRFEGEEEFAERFTLRLYYLAEPEKQGAAAVAITRVLQAEADEQGGYSLLVREEQSR